MKRLICSLFAVVVGALSCSAGVPLSYTLSTNSVEILSERPLYPTVSAWTTNKAYAQGSLVQNLGSYYFAMSSGTSSNAGSGPSFRNTTGTDNDITWTPVARDIRKGLCVANNSSDNVYLSLGLPAVAGSGILLIPNGIPFRISDYQGQVYAIGTNTSSAITVQEW